MSNVPRVGLKAERTNEGTLAPSTSSGRALQVQARTLRAGVALHPPIYHVNTHTFRHKKVFLNSEYEDLVRASFVETAAKWHIELIAFELMPSHAHLLVRPAPQTPLPKAMNLLKGRASRQLSARYPDLWFDLGGHLWNAGYYETRIKSAAQYDNVVRYIRDQKKRGGLE
ncbi:MAG: IS200/IS605 family transposase [Chloroflexi bacterium]|nr:IS200/IS605 family transposase [Chloroflexota bacterium]